MKKSLLFYDEDYKLNTKKYAPTLMLCIKKCKYTSQEISPNSICAS